MYKYCYSISFKDSRVCILILGLYSSIVTFIGYGIIDLSDRGKIISVVEFNRFLLMLSICLYYCEKSSTLCKKRNEILLFLHIYGTVCTLFYLYVVVTTYQTMADPLMTSNACTLMIFKINRIFNIQFCVIFALLMSMIQKAINEQTMRDGNT